MTDIFYANGIPFNVDWVGRAYLDAETGLIAFMRAYLADQGRALTGGSTTEATIGTGDVTLTVTENRPFASGGWVIIADRSAPTTNWMVGQISAYDAETMALTVSVSGTAGSGTLSDWVVSASGPPTSSQVPADGSVTASKIAAGAVGESALSQTLGDIAGVTSINGGWPGPPILVNGAFHVWQRGTSFSATGYTADRWYLTVGSGATASVSRQAIDLADRGAGGAYALRLTRTAAGSSATSIEQRIEGVHRLAGGVAAVSARCKAAGETAIDVIVRQYFGTGGSPSTTVDTTIGTITAGTSWSTMSVSGSVPDMSGKTLGTDGNDYVAIIFSVATTEATGAVDLDWITVSSNTATPYATEDPTDTLRRCQRYYHRTDGGGFGVGGTLAAVQGTPVTNAFLTFVHPARMRTTPTVGLFTSGGDGGWRNLRAGVVVSVSAVGGSSAATSVSSSVGTSGDALQGHIILDAEL